MERSIFLLYLACRHILLSSPKPTSLPRKNFWNFAGNQWLHSENSVHLRIEAPSAATVSHLVTSKCHGITFVSANLLLTLLCHSTMSYSIRNVTKCPLKIFSFRLNMPFSQNGKRHNLFSPISLVNYFQPQGSPLSTQS